MANNQRTTAKKVIDLFSSMRLAISLLTVLGIASIIGTVLVQNQPYSNYIIKFGQFWFGFYGMLGLYDVYHSSWFMAILTFLVLSTSLCVYRNSPVMVREWRSFHERITDRSFNHFSHAADYALIDGNAETTKAQLLSYLNDKGFRAKVKQQSDGSELIAAKAGTHQRLGYIFTHSAIVVICLGGLMDGNLPFKLQELMGTKEIETRTLPITKVNKKSFLGEDNLSYRGNMNLPEGEMSNVAFLSVRDGYMVQELPFAIELKKFKIEHYATGQPKDFESEVLIHDPDIGKSVAASIKVNHPYTYKGVSIYQSDFRDGGTTVNFKLWPIDSATYAAYPAKGVVFEKAALGTGDNKLTVEYDDFRKFNILNMSPDGKGKSKNVGPNVTYRLRDINGQAKEYVSYLNPLTAQETFRYLRIPVDNDFGIEGFMAFRSVMMNRQSHQEIGNSIASLIMAKKSPAEQNNFSQSLVKLLGVFSEGGYEAMMAALEENVPEAQRKEAGNAYIKMLGLAAYEAYNMGQAQLGEEPLQQSQENETLVLENLSTFSELFYFGSPYYFQMQDYQHKQASGFQLTKSPGQFWVYLGSCLLVLGIFAMLYIKERRIWFLIKPTEDKVRFGLSTNRKNLDFEQDFAVYQTDLQTLMHKKT